MDRFRVRDLRAHGRRDLGRGWAGLLLGAGWTGLRVGVCVAAITALAGVPGWEFLFFPELGALAFELVSHATNDWVRRPVLFVLTPALAGVWGLVLNAARHWAAAQSGLPGAFPGGLAAAGAVILTAATFRVLRYVLPPAISAALLAVVLDVRDWRYVPEVAAGTGLLWCYWRLQAPRTRPRPGASRVARAGYGLPAAAFVGVVGALGLATGIPYLLFPPLGVLAYEMFSNPQGPWGRHPWRLCLLCGTAAAWGQVCAALAAAGFPRPAMAGLAVALVSAGLSAAGEQVPPAAAVSLLPFVLPDPPAGFWLGVLASSAALSAVFLVVRQGAGRILVRSGRAVVPGSRQSGPSRRTG